MLGCPQGWTGNRWISWTMMDHGHQNRDIGHNNRDRTNNSGSITNNNKIDKRRCQKGTPTRLEMLRAANSFSTLLLVKQYWSSMCGCRIASICSVTPLSSTKWLPWNRQFHLGKKKYLSLSRGKILENPKKIVSTFAPAQWDWGVPGSICEMIIGWHVAGRSSMFFSWKRWPSKKETPNKWCKNFIHLHFPTEIPSI